MKGFYNGSLDGVTGPETKRALLRFQKNNGLEPTATLDQQTADTLIGDITVGQGSSMPKGAGAGPTTSSSGSSDSGGLTGQR